MHLKYQQQIIKPNYSSTYFFISSETLATRISETHQLHLRKHPWYHSLETGRGYPGKLSAHPALCSFRSAALGHCKAERSSPSELVPRCFMQFHSTLLCSSFHTMHVKGKSMRGEKIKGSKEQLL